ncbi:hypothetical protein [Prescottella agglutinans]|uniref:Uncharacterized protein n=1 Tax=Prescottella agglutinans TaxID=1644129 RepID=A0ABT6MFJ4_9NOCA|nr:hypothetical protein [Prescottella agglutinans]MDH6283078.1 hypothetical protein [Prescottella agglutinans]
MDVGENSTNAQPYRDYEQYPATPNGSPESYPPAGLAPDPHDHYPHAQASPYPTTMPKSVRAAQIISWVFAAIGIALAGVAFADDDIELGVTIVLVYLPGILLGILAFGYTVNGNGLRTAAIVIASLEGLISMAQRPPFLVGIAVSLTIVILLCRRSAGLWFKRPH